MTDLSVAICVFWRADQLSFLPLFESGYTEVPSLDHVSCAELEVKRTASFNTGVEDSSVDQPPCIVNIDASAGLNRWSTSLIKLTHRELCVVRRALDNFHLKQG